MWMCNRAGDMAVANMMALAGTLGCVTLCLLAGTNPGCEATPLPAADLALLEDILGDGLYPPPSNYLTDTQPHYGLGVRTVDKQQNIDIGLDEFSQKSVRGLSARDTICCPLTLCVKRGCMTRLERELDRIYWTARRR